jgi:hypothetical protein
MVAVSACSVELIFAIRGKKDSDGKKVIDKQPVLGIPTLPQKRNAKANRARGHHVYGAAS